MTEENWNEAWDNPKNIMEIENRNENSIAMLEAIKKKIKQEIKLKDSLKGYVFEEERRKTLISEISTVDPVLAVSCQNLRTRDEIDTVIERRVRELSDIREQNKKILQDVLMQQRKTSSLAQEVVGRYLSIMKEIERIRGQQIKNESLNAKYEDELREAVKTGAMQSRKSYFQQQSILYLERLNENKDLDNKAYLLAEEKITLIEKSKFIKRQFENETDKISGIIGTVRKLLGFGKKEEPQEDNFLGGRKIA